MYCVTMLEKANRGNFLKNALLFALISAEISDITW